MERNITRALTVTTILGAILAAMLVAGCGGPPDELTDDYAKKLAISKWADEELERSRESGEDLPVGAIRGTVKDAEVLSNDGRTARVRLKIVWNPNFPPDRPEIEVSLADAADD